MKPHYLNEACLVWPVSAVCSIGHWLLFKWTAKLSGDCRVYLVKYHQNSRTYDRIWWCWWLVLFIALTLVPLVGCCETSDMIVQWTWHAVVTVVYHRERWQASISSVLCKTAALWETNTETSLPLYWIWKNLKSWLLHPLLGLTPWCHCLGPTTSH